MSREDIIKNIVKFANAQDVSEIKDQYNRIKREIAVLQDQKQQVLEELRAKCDHSGIIYRCEYQPSGMILGAQGSRHMCSVCGCEQDDWDHKGHFLPTGSDVNLRTVTLSRDDFFKQRI